MSWIWCVHRHETDAEETMEGVYLLLFDVLSDLIMRPIALRIEWCKTRAQAHRWHEETILLEEEMKQVKAFFTWEGRTWLAHAMQEDISEGECAYALCQTDIRCRMRLHCINLWENVPMWLATGVAPLSK